MNAITNANRLIANFMGIDLQPMPDTDGKCFTIPGSWDIVHLDELDHGFLAYHQSWDRLIPCINKIKALPEYPRYPRQPIFDTNSISATWLFVMDFVEWYQDLRDNLPATYYKNDKVLVVGNRLRVWMDVPPMDDFNDYPPVRRYLQSQALRQRKITSLTIRDDPW